MKTTGFGKLSFEEVSQFWSFWSENLGLSSSPCEESKKYLFVASCITRLATFNFFVRELYKSRL